MPELQRGGGRLRKKARTCANTGASRVRTLVLCFLCSNILVGRRFTPSVRVEERNGKENRQGGGFSLVGFEAVDLD